MSRPHIINDKQTIDSLAKHDARVNLIFPYLSSVGFVVIYHNNSSEKIDAFLMAVELFLSHSR